METGYLFIDNNVFHTLLAISEFEQSKGLMKQSWPPPVMSFIYTYPKINKFWMHNTPSPLDIVFCCNGEVTRICYGEPNSTRIIGADLYSDLIIEFPYGTVDQSEIKLKHSVGLVKPSARELKKLISRKYR